MIELCGPALGERIRIDLRDVSAPTTCSIWTAIATANAHSVRGNVALAATAAERSPEMRRIGLRVTGDVTLPHVKLSRSLA